MPSSVVCIVLCNCEHCMLSQLAVTVASNHTQMPHLVGVTNQSLAQKVEIVIVIIVTMARVKRATLT